MGVDSYCAAVLKPSAPSGSSTVPPPRGASLDFGTQALDFFLERTSQSNEQLRALEADIAKKREESAAVSAKLRALGRCVHARVTACLRRCDFEFACGSLWWVRCLCFVTAV